MVFESAQSSCMLPPSLPYFPLEDFEARERRADPALMGVSGVYQGRI